jgi:hypothetical protein
MSTDVADAGVSAQEAQTAATTNDTQPQMTTVAGKRVKSEGQIIRESLPEGGKNGVKSLADITVVGGVEYDETGRLVSSEDGSPLATTADAYDATVGWTAQHGLALEGRDAKPIPLEAGFGLPDQTFHPDELPDPLTALKNGMLPQSTVGLRLDEAKFEKKHDFEA